MDRLRICIDPDLKNGLTFAEAKYVWRTLCRIAGLAWEFVDGRDANYDVHYGSNSTADRAKLLIKAAEYPLNINDAQYAEQDELPKFSMNRERLAELPFNSNNGQAVVINHDLIGALYALLSGALHQNLALDKWDRHDVRESFQYKNKILHQPLLDRYASYIRRQFAHLNALPKWPDGKRAALALSHDTDYPEMIRPIEAMRLALTSKKPFSKQVFGVLRGKETFWLFREWMALEQSHGYNSAFYFCPFKGNLFRYAFVAPDTFYDVRKPKYKAISDELVASGFEVGLHSSFNVYKSQQAFKEEREALESHLGHPILGNRHHYWHLDQRHPYKTLELHKNIGLNYDTSTAFEKHSGFRFGISYPYFAFNPEEQKEVRIVQLPPSLMDDHLFGYQQFTDFGTREEHVMSLVNSVHENEGLLMTDFHVRVLNATFFPGFKEIYQFMLGELAKRDFYSDTPNRIANHWYARNATLEEASVEG